MKFVKHIKYKKNTTTCTSGSRISDFLFSYSARKKNLLSEMTYKKLNNIDHLDLEILIAYVIKKPREFVLAHPERQLTQKQELIIKNYVKRRQNKEPIAYIIGHKEFYGLDFEVNKHTLIPRPETEMIVDETLGLLRSMLRNKTAVIDVGTGSGNIIISIANQTKDLRITNYELQFFATDISKSALNIAKKNAKEHHVDKKIKFLWGNLLKPFPEPKKLTELNVNNLIIVANLPYLSEKIYKESPKDVQNFEPKSALYSDNKGLAHYEKLFQQIKLLIASYQSSVTIFLEISPEQKNKIQTLVKKYFPKAKIKFKKDLASKWRVCVISF